jgi:hypothetical protein
MTVDTLCYKCPACEYFALDPDEDQPDRAVFICLMCGGRFTHNQLKVAASMSRGEIRDGARPMTRAEIRAFLRPKSAWRTEAFKLALAVSCLAVTFALIFFLYLLF